MRTLGVFLFIAGIAVLQGFLSKRESGWPGLVLPSLAFLFGLLYPLNLTAPTEGMTVGVAFRMLFAWLAGNIPTAILLAIYFGCRKKRRGNRQIDKMNIQDLN